MKRVDCLLTTRIFEAVGPLTEKFQKCLLPFKLIDISSSLSYMMIALKYLGKKQCIQKLVHSLIPNLKQLGRRIKLANLLLNVVQIRKSVS